ncbi:MAG: ISL3 family transposase [Gemmatimonadetes bacterium]|nr:ISL3 family transposase [Gemmatimonadota bacterium]
MRDVDLFQQALGLQWPWYVVSSEFVVAERRLDVSIDFERGGTFSCPECGRGGCTAWDTKEKVWRHLNFFEHEAYLHVRVPRVRCERCGVKLVEVPWARHGSGFTLLFEAMVLALVKEMPVRAVARLVGEHDTRIGRVVHHYVERARSEADFSGVRQVGIDETASKRGHNYITLFVDVEGPRLLFATEGRDHTTLAAFREDLEAHGGTAAGVEEFCLDMSPAYLKGLAAEFPEAGITFDKFHVMKLLGEAVDAVRREERRSRPELKGSRYVWLKNPENLTQRQLALLDGLDLPRLNLRTARAYHLRLAFQEFWDLEEDFAEAYLKRWYFWATHSRLAPMIKVARTIRLHWDGVLHWFRTRVSNGILEGINSLIQAAKAKARGYRSTRNLITIAYLIAGKLNMRALSPLPI